MEPTINNTINETSTANTTIIVPVLVTSQALGDVFSSEKNVCFEMYVKCDKKDGGGVFFSYRPGNHHFLTFCMK